MPVRDITSVATDTARSIRRRLAAAVRDEPDPVDERRDRAVDDARLDTLRGELVRELDRLAASDQSGSASFRRL